MALVAIVGCASHDRIVVRMAIEGEPLPLESPLPPPPPNSQWLVMDCQPSGPLVTSLFEPVAAYARTHLAERSPPGGVHVYLTIPGRPEPEDRDGVEVSVDPRARVGRLRVSSRFGGFSDGSTYCLHVLHEPGTTTIVIRQKSSWMQ
jgi:hypothetical protein